LADFKPGEVVGKDVIEELERSRAGHPDFTHVRDVEEAGSSTNGQVFFHDSGILDGHLPSSELDEPTVELAVDGVEGRMFKHGGQGA
jgi:hypothetical protein